ncbi:MAG: hypothetical protein ACI4J0_09095 [Huintestinicola sp.]|uniref:hypothetical protein n=1 Tax=Huintestinicola sp. TaxID=2981661 RepID=UPI003F02C4A6
MKIYKYTITLDTQMGVKKGILTRYAEKTLGSESGYIEILGEKNPYLAKIEPNGKCSMSGTLKTLVSNFDFRGDGYIYPDKLEIILRNGKSSLLMQGVIKEVIYENEKVL